VLRHVRQVIGNLKTSVLSNENWHSQATEIPEKLRSYHRCAYMNDECTINVSIWKLKQVCYKNYTQSVATF